ncbi:MAG TPA: protein-methionine-sulfoxide reductase catalytic subunit MsrP [Alphaproteobacteria bacterium]|jgi:sulfoxide reductase catalytic subunit YedY
MLIKTPRGWELPDSAATSETLFRQRRTLVKALAAGPIMAAGASIMTATGLLASSRAYAEDADPSADLYPAQRNMRYRPERDITDAKQVTTYNNYYEFGTDKSIYAAAQKLPIRPWTVSIEGLVEKKMAIGFDDLVRQMPLEERVYRHRCVEAWAMTVPWSGFPLKALVDFAKPLSKAKYVHFETFKDATNAPGLRQFWFPWPYVEGLTMAEATNELAFIGTGLYGKPLPKQNGAPLRLVTPWKYGFKSIKGIVKITFAEERPKTFWERSGPTEYGFWANVNPDVPHPRWSQATERLLGVDERVPTKIYNGYGEFVADLYKGLEKEKLFV